MSSHANIDMSSDVLSDFTPRQCKMYGEAEEIPENSLEEVDITEIKRSIESVVNTTPVNIPYSITYSSSSSVDDFFSTAHVEVRVPEYYHPNNADIIDTTPSSDNCPTSCSSEKAVIFVSPRGIQMQVLRIVQLISGVLSAIQMCIIGALYVRTTMPVSILLLSGKNVVLFEVSIDTVIIVRLGISVFYSFLLAVPCLYKKYAIGIVDKHNYFRWLCYSISSPLFLVLIAIMLGTTDVLTLSYIFWLSCATVLFFFIQERYEFPGTGGNMPALFGWITGLVPWVGMGVYAFVPWDENNGRVVGENTLSVLMYSTGLVGYILYGAVHVLQYNLVSVFSDYMVGELIFILLDITMNFLMTWIAHFAFDS